MVQRVTVSPSEVRGYGDIVSPKTTEDFYEYRSVLTETEGVYTLSYETKGVSLSVDSESVEYGESVVLTALVRDEGLPASGETVTFYQGETLIYTGTIGDDGTVSYTVTGLAIGSYNFTAKYDIYTSNVVNVTVTKIDTSFTVNVNPTTFIHGQDVAISGVLNGVGSGANVLITSYPNQELVAFLTTETGGAFSTTVSNIPLSTTRLYFSYVGDAYHEDALEIINVTVIDDTNYIELGVTGSSFSTGSTTPFNYTGEVLVDWGDNTGLSDYTGGALSHTYASSGNYTVKVYGEITSLRESCFIGCTGLTSINLPNTVTSIGNICFYECTGLTSVTIPDTVTNLGYYCFKNCTGLTEIALEWDTSSEILTYDNGWIDSCTSFDHFLIPEGTKSLYTAKNYPSNLLKEDGEPTPATITLTGTKSILSYADSESSVLTATVLDDNDDPVEGVSVDLYKDSVLWDTLTTGSAGTVSKTYTSAGVGDVGFTAECGSLVTETYSITDAKYYADNNKINSHMAPVGDHQGAFIPYALEYGDKVTFKFNTKPNHCLFGIGTSSSSSFVVESKTNQTIIHRSTGGTSTYTGTWLDAHSEIGLEPVYVSSSSDKTNVYFEGTYADYWNCQLRSTNNGLRVDKFTNDDYNIEIIVL